MPDIAGFPGLFAPRFHAESAGFVRCIHTLLSSGGSAGGSEISPCPRVADMGKATSQLVLPVNTTLTGDSPPFAVVILVLQQQRQRKAN